jgi:hypothetical protein
MLIKGTNGFIGLESRSVLKKSKVVESIFMFFQAKFFDFRIFLKEPSDLIFDLFFRVVTIEIGEEEFVAVGVLAFGFLLFAGRGAVFLLGLLLWSH